MPTRIGGITGYYEGGEIVVARMFGEIGKTNAGTAREGIFIGTRKDSVDMKYGTTSGKNLAYWFTTAANKTKAIVGSGNHRIQRLPMRPILDTGMIMKFTTI